MNNVVSSKKEFIIAILSSLFAIILLFAIINDGILSPSEVTNENLNKLIEQYPIYYIYYFTTQSNILVFIYIVVNAIIVFSNKTNTKFAKIIRGKYLLTAITAYILLTFFVVAFVLGGGILQGKWNFYNIGIQHGASPIVMILLFIFIPYTQTEEYKIKDFSIWKTALFIIIYPICYFILATLIGIWSPKSFPYDFLNYYNGLLPFFIHFIVILILFVWMCVGLILLKQKIDKKIN